MSDERYQNGSKSDTGMLPLAIELSDQSNYFDRQVATNIH
jgi:hypothetical protein